MFSDISADEPRQAVAFGDRVVGDGAPCLVIAEVGANHNRNYETTLRLIDAAADAGADCVKFQTFLADQHYSKYTPPVPGYDKPIHQIIEETEIDRSWLPRLKSHAEDQDLIFLSSLGDLEALDLLEKIGVVGYKNTSAELTDIGLVSAMAATEKPIILSTGLATLDEICRSVNACREVGNDQIILLQCVVSYPTDPSAANLSTMKTMQQQFGTLVGFSDHTLGNHVAAAAVAMGACVIEKHITLDQKLDGPDHKFAMEPDEFVGFVSNLRDVENAVGDGQKTGPRGAEKDIVDFARRSVHAAVEIPAGTAVTGEMLCVKRPGFGIEPWRSAEIVGRTTRADIKSDHWITWENLA